MSVDPNYIHLKSDDLKYFNSLKKSEYIDLLIVDERDFLLFKIEYVEIAKLLDKVTVDNDLKKEIKLAHDRLREARIDWVESHPDFIDS